MDTLEDAIDRVIAGPERKTRLMGEKEKRVIAYHEGGHTIVGHALPHADPVHKVSIIPRGQRAGLDAHAADRGQVPRQPRRADRPAGDDARRPRRRGAHDRRLHDRRVRRHLHAPPPPRKDMVTQYGMSAKLGPMTFGQKDSQPFLGRDFGHQPDYSATRSRVEIDREMRALIDEAHDEALEILVANRHVLEELADGLMEKETVEKEELAGVLAKVTAASVAQDQAADERRSGRRRAARPSSASCAAWRRSRCRPARARAAPRVAIAATSRPATHDDADDAVGRPTPGLGRTHPRDDRGAPRVVRPRQDHAGVRLIFEGLGLEPERLRSATRPRVSPACSTRSSPACSSTPRRARRACSRRATTSSS